MLWLLKMMVLLVIMCVFVSMWNSVVLFVLLGLMMEWIVLGIICKLMLFSVVNLLYCLMMFVVWRMGVVVMCFFFVLLVCDVVYVCVVIVFG